MKLEENQAFEKFPDLCQSILHAAHFWKTDGKWSNHIYQINLICKDHISKKSLIDFINANPNLSAKQILENLKQDLL